MQNARKILGIISVFIMALVIGGALFLRVIGSETYEVYAETSDWTYYKLQTEADYNNNPPQGTADNYNLRWRISDSTLEIETKFEDGFVFPNGNTNWLRNGNNSYWQGKSYTSSITSVKVSGNIGLIPMRFLQTMTGVETVDLSGCPNIQEIGKNAFYGCSSLKRVIWNNEASSNPLTVIRSGAFANCTNLISVMPDNGFGQLKTIDNPGDAGAFQNCKSLLFDFSRCPAIETIGKNAFHSCTALTYLDFTSCTSLKTLANDAFQACSAVKEINLSGVTSLQSIGVGTFRNLPSLTEIDMSGCTGLTRIIGEAFRDCQYVEKVSLRGCTNLTTIDYYAFQNLYRVQEYDCTGTGITSVDGLWFDSRLETLYLPNTLEKTDGKIVLDLQKHNHGSSVELKSVKLVVIDDKESNWTVTLNSAVQSTADIVYLDSDTESKTQITITADSTPDSQIPVYDGGPHYIDTYKITGKLNENDHVDYVVIEGSQTFAGVSPNVPKVAVIRDAEGNIVTGNYDITYVSGEIKVSQRPLTITASSATKNYNGEELTSDDYTVSKNPGLAPGIDEPDKIIEDSITVTGSLTEPGECNNVPSGAIIVNESVTDVTSSYAITYVSGKLTVNPKVTIKKTLTNVPSGVSGTFSFSADNAIRTETGTEAGECNFDVSSSETDGTDIWIPYGQTVNITESVSSYYYETSINVTPAEGGESPISGETFSSAVTKNTTLEYVNDKKPVCRIWNEQSEQYDEFATLGAAVTAANTKKNNKVLYNGTIEMLINYIMPAYDTVTIGSRKEITLTTASTAKDEEGQTISGAAWIKRRNTIASNTPMIESNGKLTFESIILDGNGTEASAEAAVVKVSNGTLTMNSGATIRNAVNNGNGGAVYIKNGKTFNMKGGSISGNTAALGAAVYLENNAKLYMSGGSITNNRGTSTDSSHINEGGAVNVAGTGSRLYFSGASKVTGNYGGTGSTIKNVVLNVDSAAVINSGIDGNGLSSNAEIGIYVTDRKSQNTNLYEKYGISGVYFGTFVDESDRGHPECFTNDRNVFTGGSEDDSYIYWKGTVCKVVYIENEKTKEKLFSSITEAVNWIEAGTHTYPSVEGSEKYQGNPVIQMLIDYTIPRTDQAQIAYNTNITLTTASREKETGLPDYDGDFTPSSSSEARATITRKTGNEYPFISVNSSNTNGNTTFKLMDIILDGDRGDVSGNGGGALNAKKTSVTVSNVEVKNFKAKDGGAILTTGNSLTVKKSVFKNCESTLDTDKHGGGAINTEAKSLDVSGCHFKECTAKRQGGALFQNTSDTESTASVSDCTFDSCSSTNGSGGAIELDAGKKANVTDCIFTKCTSTKNAGAINIFSIGDQNRKSTNTYSTITGCTFTECTSSAADASADQYCSGGGIRSTAFDTKIIDCTFTGCKDVYGGGVAFTNDSNAPKSLVEGCRFDSCEAIRNGGAIYCRIGSLDVKAIIKEAEGDNEAVFEPTVINSCESSGNSGKGGGVQISKTGSLHFDGGNKTGKQGVKIEGCSSKTGGAVDSDDKEIKFYFKGNVRIYNNKDSSGTQHNVVLDQNANTKIYTEGTGLGSFAKIGIYVTDGNPFNNHGKVTQPFGTWTEADSDNIGRFINDRNTVLYGTTGTDPSLMYWNAHICKITDSEGRTLKKADNSDAVYMYSDTQGALIHAFSDFSSISGAACIKMIVPEYDMLKEGTVSVPKSLTFTTAGRTSETDKDGKYLYRGDEDTDKISTVSIVNRGACTGTMFSSAASGTEFTITDITLDGGAVYDESGINTGYSFTGNGGIVNANAGKLILGSEKAGGGGETTYDTTILRNSAVEGTAAENGRGGAVYIGKTASVTAYGADITGCRAVNGGAVYVDAKTGSDSSASVVINGGNMSDHIVSRSGGAVYIDSNRKAEITGTVMQRNEATGDVYINENDEDNGCGGAVYIYKNCNVILDKVTIGSSDNADDGNKSYKGGGGVLFRSKLRVKDSIIGCNNASFGGGIAEWLESTELRIENTTITNNTAERRSTTKGGVHTFISGNGGGIAQQSWDNVNIEGGSISGNTAEVNGGGAYIRGKGSTLDGVTVSGNTASSGGGIYAGTITLINTSVSSNRLKGSGIGNGGGLFVDSLLIIGKAGAEDDTTDISSNLASDGKSSNVRLPRNDYGGKKYNSRPDQTNEGIRLLCTKKSGRILVSNPGDYNTRFGYAGEGYIELNEDNCWDDGSWDTAVFATDDDTDMFGIIKKDGDQYYLYWWKRPVAKIMGYVIKEDGTREEQILYTSSTISDDSKAVYAFLYPRSNDPVSVQTDSSYAFAVLNNARPQLYLSSGELYTGNEYVVRMLENYRIRYPVNIYDKNKDGLKIKLTTAEKKESNTDGYWYRPDGDTAVIYRGRNAQKDSYGFMFTTHDDASLTLEDITMDGGIRFLDGKDDKGYPIIDGQNSSISPKDGVFVCLYDNSVLTLDNGATLQNAYTDVASGCEWGGGALCHGEISSNTKIYLKDGSRIVNCGSRTYGGAISNHRNGTTYMQGGVIENCWAGIAGGAIYTENNNTNIVMTGGTIRNCLAPVGGGIYLGHKAGSELKMQGSVRFNGNYGTDYNLLKDGINGGEEEYRSGMVRQDIYVKHFKSSGPVASIVLTGNVSAPDGSIWVWSEPSPYHKIRRQFAIAEKGVNESSYSIFRDACPDSTINGYSGTDNDTGVYLTGTGGPSIRKIKCIYWGPSQVSGSRKVILRKVKDSDDKFTPLQRNFIIYKSDGNTLATDADGNVINTNGNPIRSSASGVIWIGQLAYDTYVIEEQDPKRSFTIIVNKDGIFNKDNRETRKIRAD